MKKILIQILLSVFCGILWSSICHYRPTESAINTLYSVSAILFSVGISLVVTIIPNGIKNKGYVKRIKGTLDRVRNCFFIEFSIITVLHLFLLDHNSWPTYPFELFACHVILDPITVETFLICFSFIYYSFNFLELQKLNRDIFDASYE